MLFGYVVLKGEDSFLTYISASVFLETCISTQTTQITPHNPNTVSSVHFNVPGTDAVVNIGVHLPQHTAQRTRQADPESCGQETLHDAAGRGTHETHSGITTRNVNLLLNSTVRDNN